MFKQLKTKNCLRMLLMLRQWSEREWRRWGTAVWSPQLWSMWRRCSSLRWSTFQRKHTPSTTLPPACVLLCPSGKSISSWAMRMRRGPGGAGMMPWWFYQSVAPGKLTVLGSRLLLIDGSIAQKWRDKMTRKIKVRIRYSTHSQRASLCGWLNTCSELRQWIWGLFR